MLLTLMLASVSVEMLLPPPSSRWPEMVTRVPACPLAGVTDVMSPSRL